MRALVIAVLAAAALLPSGALGGVHVHGGDSLLIDTVAPYNVHWGLTELDLTNVTMRIVRDEEHARICSIPFLTSMDDILSIMMDFMADVLYLDVSDHTCGYTVGFPLTDYAHHFYCGFASTVIMQDTNMVGFGFTHSSLQEGSQQPATPCAFTIGFKTAAMDEVAGPTIQVDVTMDEDPSDPYFQSWFGLLWFRGFITILYVFVTFKCAQCFLRRLRSKTALSLPGCVLVVTTLSTASLIIPQALGSTGMSNNMSLTVMTLFYTELFGFSAAMNLLVGVAYSDVCSKSVFTAKGRKSRGWQIFDKIVRVIWILFAIMIIFFEILIPIVLYNPGTAAEFLQVYMIAQTPLWISLMVGNGAYMLLQVYRVRKNLRSAGSHTAQDPLVLFERRLRFWVYVNVFATSVMLFAMFVLGFVQLTKDEFHPMLWFTQLSLLKFSKAGLTLAQAEISAPAKKRNKRRVTATGTTVARTSAMGSSATSPTSQAK